MGIGGLRKHTKMPVGFIYKFELYLLIFLNRCFNHNDKLEARFTEGTYYY